MPATTIRRLTPADARAYRQVRLRSVAEHPEAFVSSHEEELANSIAVWEARLGADAGSASLGAFEGGELVGICSLLSSDREKTEHKCFVGGMYVKPAVRGHGLGRGLLRAAIEHARAIPGLSVVHLSVNVTNTAARELYVSEGFVSWAVERDSFRVNGAPQDEEYLRFELR